MAPAVTAIKRRAVKIAWHSSAASTVAKAQAAAVRPAIEQERGAAVATVNELDGAQEETEAFKRESFKDAFRKAIEKATPNPTNEEEAHQVIESGAQSASAALQPQLAGQKDAAAGPLKRPGEVGPQDLGPAPPEVPLQAEQVGEPPAPVSAAPVVPAPLAAKRLDYSEDREATDRAMEEDNVSKAQLEKGNEPEFAQTIDARSEAEEHETRAATHYRASEAGLRAGAEQRAQGTLTGGLVGMQGARAGAIGKVASQQVRAMTRDEAERRRVTTTIEGIKNQTRNDVDTILKEMDSEASRIFGEGLAVAEHAYRETFEEEKGGVGTWVTTWGSDWEELIENSLVKARREYLRQVDIVIDKVADCVDTKLAAAKKRVIEGRTHVEAFVEGLDKSVRAFGEEALVSVSGDFDAMTESIDARRDALVENLTTQFKASYERMSVMEEELRNANKSLWQRVYDATVGVIKKILAFKDLLLSVLAKAADAVGDIIADPIGFLGNLVSGVALGLKSFVANIGKHLRKGLMDWLFGALGGAGITMPESFDLKGIVDIVLQVLGLTYANFRARAVKIVGEPVVSALEKTAEVFRIVATEGVPGLWRFIKDKVVELKSMVLDAIFEFIKEKVIVAGITWVVGLLNPASAFFKACKAIYDIIMFFVTRGSQILDLVNAVIDSIGAIAKGSIGVAAKFIEDALAKAVPVAIGFLAGLLGLGDISATIRKTIDNARAPVNDALDWVIGQAVKLVKAVGDLFGRRKAGGDDAGFDGDPWAQAAAELKTRLTGQQTLEEAENEVAAVLEALQPHGLSGLEVRPSTSDGGYEIFAAASPWEKMGELMPKNPETGKIIGKSVRMKTTLTLEEGVEIEGAKGTSPVPLTDEEGGVFLKLREVDVQYVNARTARGRRRGGRIEGGGYVYQSPKSPTEIKTLTYNTGEDPDSRSNATHAEHQLEEFLRKNEEAIAKKVIRIEVEISMSPCSLCTAALNKITKLTPAAAEARTMTWSELYKSKVDSPRDFDKSTTEDSLSKIDDWKLIGDRPVGAGGDEQFTAKVEAKPTIVRKRSGR